MWRLLLFDEGTRSLDDTERRLGQGDCDAERTGHSEQGGQRERERELAPEALAHRHEAVEEPKGEEGEAADGEREPEQDFQGVVDALAHCQHLHAEKRHQQARGAKASPCCAEHTTPGVPSLTRALAPVPRRGRVTWNSARKVHTGITARTCSSSNFQQ